ncbi:hypothetical protein [Ramlibacter sp. WS9]|uniref:hypothetical protein n=1 Tax=Ramlibacter sp. WS9 TaxID=1882741 RepID=UPI001145171A|nr:hypothetical protein [Ramlibacter sp. WS9]
MNPHSTQSSKDILRRYRSYGLFGGAAVGAVVGVLVSGPNFREWAATQSLAVIAGFMVGIALIGYFFLAQVFGASTGGDALNNDREEEHGRARGEATGVGTENGNDGD